MYFDVIFAGFGGQGLLMAGDLLAFSYMREGFEITWFPSYGVEMRGGAASCTVVVSSEKIGSPIVESPQAAACLSWPALEKFQGKVRQDGLLIVNTSLIDPQKVSRKDLKIIFLPANKLAMEKLGQIKMANMIILGALAAAHKNLDFNIILNALPAYFAEKKALIALVKQGLLLGQEWLVTNK
ncbi:MAG: 2-oxoacid:ferredoxin oxidoreductase subunit gamma [Firmicutes bacterium]|nr:2-oxoacid:ferredoxin oxidoreductase subunit gamma [Bacillota bacterium]